MKEKFGKKYFYGAVESNYYNYDEMDFSKVFKTVILFVRNNKLKGRFLDIGCAFGMLLKKLSENFSGLYGCDISKFAIEKARKNIPKAHLKVVDIGESLPYKDEYFDLITALDVLEHTKNFEKNFKKIVRKLKTKGYLIISMPIYALPRRLFGFLDKDKTHVSILKEKEIMQIVKRNKLSVLSKKYFAAIPIFYKIPHIPYEMELILRKE